MKARRMAVPVLLVAGMALTTPGAAGAQGGTTFRATLKGANEIGGGAGSGSWVGRFRSRNRLCYTLRTHGVRNVVAAHIHTGRRGVNGNIVIDLGNVHAGRTTQCVHLDAAGRAARAAIRSTPRAFYVNVHTQRFPGGTMRGQLRHG